MFSTPRGAAATLQFNWRVNMPKYANDNFDIAQVRANTSSPEILGYDPRLQVFVVTMEEVKDDGFRRDGFDAMALEIRKIEKTNRKNKKAQSYRDIFDHYMTEYANFTGWFSDTDGKEFIFDEEVILNTSDEWCRDNIYYRSVGDPPVKLRTENRKRIQFLLSMQKMITPANAIMWGKEISNDNIKV
jgi:hypothetical protein